MLWTQHALLGGIKVERVTHIDAGHNTRTDILSREGTWRDVLIEDKARYGGTLPDGVPFLDLRPGNLLDLINPNRSLDSEEEFENFFSESLRFLRE